MDRDGGSDEVASGIGGGSCVVWKRAVRSGGSKAVVMLARLPCSEKGQT